MSGTKLAGSGGSAAGGGLALAAGLAWLGPVTVLSTYANSAFLSAVGSPLAHTVVRFWGSLALGAAWNGLGARNAALELRGGGPRSASALAPRFALPAALLLGANLLNSVALQASGVTLAYVVKSLIPVFTVALSFLQGAQYSRTTLLTLVPVVLGVALAAWSDMELTAVGLGGALASTLLQTLLNLSVKRAIEESKLGGVQAQLLMVGMASALLLVPSALALAGDPAGLSRLWAAAATPEGRKIIALAAVAYHTEYVLNFVVTALFRPLTFAVADIARRLLIIGVGAIMFGKPLSALNLAGIATCFCGVAAYTALSQGPSSKSKSA